jgi:GTP cyclohydrolase III
MSCYVVTSRMYSYTAVQKNRVHFKNQAIKFPGILCFVNGDFIIISLNPSPPGGTAILPEYIHYYG